jgi:hypothetical protein
MFGNGKEPMTGKTLINNEYLYITQKQVETKLS